MKIQLKYNERSLEILLHVICWSIFIAFPLLIADRNSDSFNWWDYLRRAMLPCIYMIVFYINYFILIPRYLFNSQARNYIIYNILLILVLGILLHFWQETITSPPPHEHLPIRKNRPPRWSFFVRDLLGMAFTIGASAMICITKRWTKTENARREAEKSRTEAELKNLRNQLNPHFLLNTLNNIYALTAFDTGKAQQAIQELSKLLRYMLYDNQMDYVSLNKEAGFIHNYIELMRIRLSSNVNLETHIDIAPHSRVQITPLIFISLIENAFKHGISPDKPSFVYISLSENNGLVVCEIRNSNFPKTDSDKSGSGIGLAQVQKRLDLLYPNNYTWEKGTSPDGEEYYSKLSIVTFNSQLI